jgi:4-diphosphocytidyl-2-C-methyl-D-erythritol kinase
VISFPNCKINIGLHILQKREDGFHNLETVFYPVPFTDALEIITNHDSKEPVLSLSGLAVDALMEDNICIKAWRLLKNDFKDLPSVNIHLHKTIPTGAGLGGGSSDGAFTLVQLNKLFRLELTQKQLISYALQLGSDCPFFIINKPCIAKGRGEILQEIDLDLSSYKLILINPGIHINTAWAFSQLNPGRNNGEVQNIIKQPLTQWKDLLKNDFERPVFDKYPEIGNIKDLLYKSGALYASMSGSGSTVVGIFQKTVNPVINFPSSYLIKHF